MAGPVTRRGERRSVEDSAAATKELEIFSKIAAAIGDTLEAVCNMQESERRELITVLGLEIPGTSDHTGSFSVETEFKEQESPLVDSGDTAVNNNEDNLDDDLKVVAIRKRKRSPSFERDRKRKISAESGSRSPKADFSKYVGSRNGNTGAKPVTVATEPEGQETNKDAGASQRTSADIMKVLETDNDPNSKDLTGGSSEELRGNIAAILRENIDDKVNMDDDESLSLLGEPMKSVVDTKNNFDADGSHLVSKKVQVKSNDTGLSDKQIHELLDGSDDEPSNQQVSEENSEELLMDNEDISNEGTDEKLSKVCKRLMVNGDISNEGVGEKLSNVHARLISSCSLELSGKSCIALGKIFERRICKPEEVLKKDNLPLITGLPGGKWEGRESMQTLSKYFTEKWQLRQYCVLREGRPRIHRMCWYSLPRRGKQMMLLVLEIASKL
jgi:hypothetical protein